MARVIPIKGLDTDLEKVVNDLKSTIERRNHLNDYIEALTNIQDIYMKIKILAGTLGFSVKEIEFSEKTISNLDILFNNSNMSQSDIKQYEIDKNNYLDKMNSAQEQVISKSQELDNQINLLLELKENVKVNLADKDFTSIDNILKSLDQFVIALDLKRVVEKAIKDQKNPIKKVVIEQPNEEEQNSLETDDFSYLNDIVSEGSMVNTGSNSNYNTIKEEKISEDKEETPFVEPIVQEENIIPTGKKVVTISNINPTINAILHPEMAKPVVEDQVDVFSNNGPVIPTSDQVNYTDDSIFETIPGINN